MATATIADVRNNLTSTLRSVTSSIEPDASFVELDSGGGEADVGGEDLARAFYVAFLDEGFPDTGYWTVGEREKVAHFEIVIAYPSTGAWAIDTDRILSETHDVVTALQTQSNWGSSTILQQVVETPAPVERVDEHDSAVRYWLQKLKVEVHYIAAC